MARPVYTASSTEVPRWADVAGGTAGFQPVMFPVWDAKMKRDGAVGAPSGILKSVELLNTCPVGDPPGMVTTSGFLANVPPLTSPLYRVDLPVPLSETQNG